MMWVSVTRLRLRSWRFLPAFLWHSIVTVRQVKRAPGFLGGQLANEPWRAFWTVTVWRDQASMRACRNAGAHARAMPRLLHWCDEASFVHWTQDDAGLPTLQQAAARMVAEGVVSKVRYPSALHARGEIVLSEPRPAQRIDAVS